ncbi:MULTISPECIES: hypothetical protein [Thermodesulfovibrio]|uniref:hypothetical protein n=1 Tax=Thermodesulfovibrio TaxID=28261 RepID=UPI0026157F77|nr:hypothetical protein [Thermodesulfovibrio sp.]
MRLLLIVSILILIPVLIPALSIAVDELYLTGKVVYYEPDTGKIKIDVFSDSCKGLREFYTEKKLSKELILNRVIDFGIDSDHCDRFKTHTITTPLLK